MGIEMDGVDTRSGREGQERCALSFNRQRTTSSLVSHLVLLGVHRAAQYSIRKRRNRFDDNRILRSQPTDGMDSL